MAAEVAPHSAPTAAQTTAHRWVFEYFLARCTDALLNGTADYEEWARAIEAFRGVYVRDDTHDTTVWTRAQLAKVLVYIAQQKFAEAAASLEQMLDQAGLGHTDAQAQLLLVLRVQAVVSAAADPTMFLLAINANFQAPSAATGTPLQLMIAQQLRRLRKQLTACLDTADDDDGDAAPVVDNRKLDTIDHEYGLEQLVQHVRVVADDIIAKLPAPALLSMAERELAGGNRRAGGRASARAPDGRPGNNALPLAALRRIAPSAATWQRIITETDPFVKTFLRSLRGSAGANSTNDTRPVSRRASPARPAVASRATSRQLVRLAQPVRKPMRRTLMPVGGSEDDGDDDEDALPTSSAAQQALDDLKQSTSKLTQVVNDPLQELIQPDGRVHVPRPPAANGSGRGVAFDDDETQDPRGPAGRAQQQAKRKRHMLESFSDDERDEWPELGDSSAGGGARAGAAAAGNVDDDDDIAEDEGAGSLDGTRLQNVNVRVFSHLVTHPVVVDPKQQRRLPRPWTVEEEDNLAKGLREYNGTHNKWARIHGAYEFPNRTPQDLKDKARILSFRIKYGLQ